MKPILRIIPNDLCEIAFSGAKQSTCFFDSVEILFSRMPSDFKTCFLNHKNDIHLVSVKRSKLLNVLSLVKTNPDLLDPTKSDIYIRNSQVSINHLQKTNGDLSLINDHIDFMNFFIFLRDLEIPVHGFDTIQSVILHRFYTESIELKMSFLKAIKSLVTEKWYSKCEEAFNRIDFKSIESIKGGYSKIDIFLRMMVIKISLGGVHPVWTPSQQSGFSVIKEILLSKGPIMVSIKQLGHYFFKSEELVEGHPFGIPLYQLTNPCAEKIESQMVSHCCLIVGCYTNKNGDDMLIYRDFKRNDQGDAMYRYYELSYDDFCLKVLPIYRSYTGETDSNYLTINSDIIYPLRNYASCNDNVQSSDAVQECKTSLCSDSSSINERRFNFIKMIIINSQERFESLMGRLKGGQLFKAEKDGFKLLFACNKATCSKLLNRTDVNVLKSRKLKKPGRYQLTLKLRPN